MPHQQNLNFKNVKTVNVNQYNQSSRQVPQSKDDFLRARVEPRTAQLIKNKCFEKNITLSDYIRDGADICEIYHDFKDVLLSESEVIIPLLERLSKKF